MQDTSFKTWDAAGRLVADVGDSIRVGEHTDGIFVSIVGYNQDADDGNNVAASLTVDTARARALVAALNTVIAAKEDGR